MTALETIFAQNWIEQFKCDRIRHTNNPDAVMSRIGADSPAGFIASGFLWCRTPEGDEWQRRASDFDRSGVFRNELTR